MQNSSSPENSFLAIVNRVALQALKGQSSRALSGVVVQVMCEALRVELVTLEELLPDGARLVRNAGPGWHRQGNKPLQGELTLGDMPLGALTAPIAVPDAQTETRFAVPEMLLANGARSGLCVAVRHRDEYLGGIAAFTREERTFRPEEIDFVRHLADILAATIVRDRKDEDSSRTQEKQRRFNDVLVMLSRITLQHHTQIDRIFETITEAAAAALQAERTSIWLYNSDRTTIQCLDLFQASTGSHVRGMELTARQFPSYFQALENERIIASADAFEDPRTREFGETGYLQTNGISALLDAPIRVEGIMAGVVCTEHVGDGPRVWTPAEQNFAGSIADATSLVLEAAAVRRAEEALIWSENRYRELFENANDLVFIHDLDGNFISINHAMERATGYSRQEIRSRNVAELIVSPQDDDAFDAVRDFSSGNITYELEIKTKAGDRVPVEITTQVIAENRKPVGIQGIARNITERKRAEEKRIASLRQLLESIRIINSGTDLTAVLESIAHEAATLVDGTPGAIGLVEDQQITYKRIWNHGKWEDGALSFPLGTGIVGKVARTGRSAVVNDPDDWSTAEFSERVVKLYIHGWMTVPIVSRDGTVVGVIDVRRYPGRAGFSDTDRQLVEYLANQAAVAIENASLYSELETKNEIITQSILQLRELYEKEQEVTKMLQRLDRMRTNFLVVASHEMMTPLTIIRGYSDALAAGDLGTVDDQQKKALITCQQMVDRLAGSFQNLMEMLKINEGQITLNPFPFDLAGLIRDLIDEFRLFFEMRRLSLSTNLPEYLVITADRDKTRTVLANILQNAIKFTGDGGRIAVSLESDSEWARLSVSDSGIGISPEDLDHIFDPFYTSADSTQHSSGTYEFMARGSGLGLAIARSYIEAQCGTIAVRSNGNQLGSEFRIDLPLFAKVTTGRPVSRLFK